MDALDEEALRLMMRILELRSRINSQMNRLNNVIPLDGNLKKHQLKVDEALRRLFETKGPHKISNPKIGMKYRGSYPYALPDEEKLEDWRLATFSQDRLTHDSKCCMECRY